MYKNHWIAVFFVTAFFAGCAMNGAFAQTADVKLPPNLTVGLSQGSRGDVVRELQEFLAQDKDVYPEGLVTGYFGPLTVQAVKRWQEKNGIEAVGIVGPKTRAKFKQLIESAVTAGQAAKSVVVAPAPSSEPTLEPTPTPAPPLPVNPRDLIKTGSDTIGTNKTLTVGPAKFYLSALISNPGRFYLTPVDPAAQIANISRDTKTSPCEEGVSARGYSGPSNVCSFTDPARYTFSEHKDAIRIFKKNASNLGSSCSDGILLFKHSGIYGGIEFESIDAVGQIHYNYWYDESGGTNFNLLCSSTENNAVKIQLANALESLKNLLLEVLKLQP